MSILGIVFPTTGLADASPQLLYIKTNDTLAAVITANYLDQAKAIYGNIFSNYQMAIVYTSDAKSVILQVQVSTDGVHASLAQAPSGPETFTNITVGVGSAAVPSINFLGDLDTGIYHVAANSVGIAANGALVAAISTTGVAVTGLVSASTSVAAGTTVAAATTVTAGTGVVATTGTIQALAGNVIAGSSTHAASVISFPSSAANGTLILAAVNAGGAFNTTISNGTMGQSTVYTIGDIGAATGGLVAATAPVLMKRVANAAVAGGAAAQTVTDAFCTSAACTVIANYRDTTTPTGILTVLAGNGSFVVTSTVDPGASHIDYVIYK